MDRLLQDLRYACRSLAKAPAFAGVAITVLALGVGANTAIFTLVNALVFRPLSGQADELVGLYNYERTKPDSYRAFSYPNYADIRDQSAVFDGLMAHIGHPEDSGFVIVEAWRTEELFRSYLDQLLLPALAEAGLESHHLAISPAWSIARP